MINVTEHFATDFQELKSSSTERIDKIERLILENVAEYETKDMKHEVKTKVMEQQIELFQNGHNRLKVETESLFKVIELLLAHQINTGKIHGNTEKIIKVKEAGTGKKNKLNH